MARASREEPELGPGGVVSRDDLRGALSGLRRRSGLTIREIATATDIPFSTVGGYFSVRHLPTSAQQPQFAKILQTCGVSDPEQVEQWLDAVRRVRRKPGRPAGSAGTPYRGLEAFQSDDAEWFHGRDALTQALVDHVTSAETGVVVVVGPSGAGKSSLLRAGLMASLDESWRPVLMTPGPQPLEALDRSLTDSLTAGDNLVLIVDQFEEVFTLCQDGAVRLSFIDALFAQSARVVLGMRADFYSHALANPKLAAALQRGQLIVGPMSEKDLRRAIVEPARQARIDLDDGLVELLVRELAPGTGGAGDAAHDPGALPLLSHALLATWEQGRKGRMTVEDYRASGGITGAIGKTAEAVYGQLTEEQKEIARRTFLRLVRLGEDTADTRRRVDRDELICGDHATESVLDHFVAGRLVTTDVDTVEISHEALLLAWPRLRAWIDADRAGIRVHRQLTDAAQVWRDGGRDRGALYRGGRLVAAVEYAQRAELNSQEQEFLDASVAEDQAERAAQRRRVRHMQRLVAGLVVLALVAAGLAVYASAQRDNADRERDHAISRQVATTANRLRDTDPALAAQLSLAAYRIAPTVEARSGLLASSAVHRVTRMTRPNRALQAVTTAPNGRLLAAAGATKNDHEVLLWDLAEPSAPRLVDARLTGHSDAIYAAAFTSDGRLLVTGSADKTVRLWDVADPNRPAPLGEPLTGPAERVLAVAVSPDGTLLAAGGGDKAVRLWNLADPRRPVALGEPLPGATGATQSIAFSPDGTIMAVADAGGAVHLWDVTDRSAPRRAGAALPVPSRVNVVAFTPDGKTVVAGSNDGMLRSWHITDPAAPAPAGEPLEAATGWINAVAFSSDGRTIAVANADSAVQLWDLPGRRQIGTLPHPEPVTAVAFTDNNGTLITNSADGTTRAWSVPGPIVPAPSTNITTITFDRPGVLLAAAGADIQLWNVADRLRPAPAGPPLRAPDGYDRMGGTVAVSPDGRTLAAGTRKPNAVILWDISDPARPVRIETALTGPAALIESVRFSPDGAVLAASSGDGTVRLWRISDPHRPEPLATLTTDAGAAYAIAFSPDGRTLASATSGGVVALWDLADVRAPRRVNGELEASKDFTYSVAFSPDGGTLAAGSGDGSVQLWDLRNGPRRSTRITGPDGYVLSLAFSPDGRTLAAGTGTAQTWLWRLDGATAEPLALVPGAPKDNIWKLAFHPGGSTLAAATGGVRLMDPDPDRIAAQICATRGSPITEAEWHKHVPGAAPVPICP